MKKPSLRDTIMDFNIGGLGEARFRSVRIAGYDTVKKEDDIELVPKFLKPELFTPILPYYKVSGQELMLQILNLYKSIKDLDLDGSAEIIEKWCMNNIHPYAYPELMNTFGDPWEYHWIRLEASGIGIISARRFKYDCRVFFYNAAAMLTLTLINLGREKDADRLYHTYFFDEGFDLYEEYMRNPNYSKEYLAADNYAMLQPVTMKLEFDVERMQPVFMPEINSIFDILNYTLVRMVAANAPALNENWRRQSIAICESCGELFIKEGNRQKYCKSPLCQAERNNRKAQAYYLRQKSESSNEALQP